MPWFTEQCRRFCMLFQRQQFHRDLQDEMNLHLELRREEHLRDGVSPENAHATAQRGFGNTTLLRESGGDVWTWRMLDDFAQDLRYGARALVRTPGFTAVAVFTLALGIGANTAIFSVANAVLLRPLAYQDPDRLVTLLHSGSDPVAPANYIDWRDQNRSFETMAAAESWSPNLTGGDAPEHLLGIRLTQNVLPMLGVGPSLGRLFAPGEDLPGSEHEVILSHALWRRRFNGDPQIVGKSVTLNGENFTIVGVMPPQFKFAPFWNTHAELWAPLAMGGRIHNRGGNSLRVFARLKSGVTLTQSRSEIAAITASLERQYPGTNRNVTVTPLKEKVVGKIESSLLMLLGACGFVLLIACANVAHMLLARTSDRRKEIAVRTALGAGSSRVIRQFLTENLLLATAGASGGFLLALWGIRVLVALSPTNIPRVETIEMDAHGVLFLLGVTFLTALVFGLAPALHAAVGNLSGALKESGRAGTDGVRSGRVRGFLVASEFALAFMLLIGAGLMIRSFLALQALDPGFNPSHVLSMVVSVAGTNLAEPGRRENFYRQLLQQVRTVPGVVSAGAINHLPLAGDMWGTSFNIEGRPTPRPGEGPSAVYRIVMPGYFETMRLPLRRGRTIAEYDHARAPDVVIVNERAARTYWPTENPIGKRITFDDPSRANPPEWLTIIGVAANAKQGDWANDPTPEVYIAALQNRQFLSDAGSHYKYITLVVRAAGNPADLAPVIKRTVWTFDRNLPISEVVTMDRVVADATAQPRFEMLLLVVFAAVALLLAAVGIYGVMSYAVSRRTREIGIRLSLGATRAQVLRMVIRQGMTQAVAGAAAGVAGALLLTRLMSGMLFGVRPTDPLTFCAVALVLCLAAMAASCVPARNATRIEPMTALRED
jgi:predicted permease